MIPFTLDDVIHRLRRDPFRPAWTGLAVLAGVPLSPAEARAEWPRVLDHKWYLSERLSRDVGLRVAAVDYFDNVRALRRTGLRAA